MIALLIGGMVVLCIGLLTVVFGIPIKEFSFGNTMILAGAVVSCTGLVLIGLYFIGREFRNLARRLEAGDAAPLVSALPRQKTAIPPKPEPVHEDMLFTRDQSPDLGRAREEFSVPPSHDTGARVHLPESESAPPWQDHPLSRARNSAPPPVSLDPPAEPAEPAERPRRNIMFSSHRRDGKDRSLLSRDLTPPSLDNDAPQPPAEDHHHRDPEPEAAGSFDSAWPQTSRSRPGASARNGQTDESTPAADDSDMAEPVRERFQLPRRADASSVTIVKSGVVDSMAYSLYSDGSIEAQMPEGMVRFASIDELRAHLDERN
jgi:hypothetical protein